MMLSRRLSYEQYYRRTYNTAFKMYIQNYTATCVLRNTKTHQTKLLQSCREYQAIKAGDSVAFLRMTRTRQMQRRNNINHATSAQQAPLTPHTHTTKTESEMMKTHQPKLRQSCREYRAIKAEDWVVALRMTCTRQIQRRNKNNHATSTPHAPRTSHTHTTTQSLQASTTHQIKLRQSCRKYRAIKAGDVVVRLRMTRKRQILSRNKINQTTFAQHAPRTSYTHTTNQSLQ